MLSLLIFLLTSYHLRISLCSNVPSIQSYAKMTIFVNKCCLQKEVMIDHKCKTINTTLDWSPVFLNKHKPLPEFELLTGYPNCGNTQLWPIYDTNYDRLRLLYDGTLRHYILKESDNDEIITDDDLNDEKILFNDYKEGNYCIETIIDSRNEKEMYFAFVCAPEVKNSWHDAEFVLTKLVDPICHATAIICYVTVAIIHFVLPQLRDVTGNIITTICMCLAVSQAADLVRIFSEIGHPMSYLIADIIMLISLLAAFFWLCSLGFYIWKTFRSNNVFLRMTDGRKYCYYSYYVWSSTIAMSFVAVFSHFFLDLPPNKDVYETYKLGWLGLAVFFSPIACTVLLIIYFYLSTHNVMANLASYGRIHHKLKFCFETFLKLSLIMAVCWLFLMFSWMPYTGLRYAYIVINAFEAPLILYVSVLSQRRVRFLLRKVCCFETCLCPWFRPNQPSDIPEWGEEMMAMHQ